MWSASASCWLAGLLLASLFVGNAGAQDVLIKLEADKKPVQATVKIVPPYGTVERETVKGEKWFKCPFPETMIEVEPGDLHYILPKDMKKRCVGPEVVFVLYLHGSFDNSNIAQRDRNTRRTPRAAQLSAPTTN